MKKNDSQDDAYTSLPDTNGRIPTLRLVPMPADANAAGDIFGGWILSQMDIAGAVHAYRVALGRIVTVGIEAMSFHKPVLIGDQVSFYTEIFKTGRTSVTIKIESWALRRSDHAYEKVTEGLFTYVHVDEKRIPVALPAQKP